MRAAFAIAAVSTALWLVAACSPSEPAPFATHKKSDAGTPNDENGSAGAPSCGDRDCAPGECDDASDCTPIVCQHVACIDHKCMDLGDRPTTTNAKEGIVNLPCPSDAVCGPGIPNGGACCAETCSNGCGGPACSSNGNSPYCCVQVIKKGGDGHPPAAECSDKPSPPCLRP